MKIMMLVRNDSVGILGIGVVYMYPKHWRSRDEYPSFELPVCTCCITLLCGRVFKRQICVFPPPFFLKSDYLWTHQPGSHRRKVTQVFSTFLLRCLLYFFSREIFSRSFPSSTVKSNFVYPRNRSPLVGCDFFLLFSHFCEEKFHLVC